MEGTKAITSGEINLCKWNWRNKVVLHFYQDKFKADPATIRRISWSVCATIKNAITSSLKQFSFKVMIRWLASATRLEMYGNEIDTCHLCTMQETNYHIFQCSYRTRAFLMRHKALQTFLNSIQTPNELIEPIANCILYWALQTQNPTNLIALQQSYPNVIA